MGYTRKKKIEKLWDLGITWKKEYLRTTESDCDLGLVLPAIERLTHAQSRPKAGAMREFLSGYLTREEWLESLVRANTFTPKIPKRRWTI